MKIAVYSDIHENFYNLRKVLQIMKERNVKEAFCLGDFIHPGIVKEMISHGIKTRGIFGNNDGEKYGLTMAAVNSNGIFSLSEKNYETFTIDNKRVVLIHHPDLAPALAKSGEFDAVFYGHNHKKHSEKVGNCLLANPGEVSSHVTNTCSFIIWDTTSNEAESIDIKDFLNTNK